jgi:hypothetical protein
MAAPKQYLGFHAEGAGSVPVGFIQQILRHRRATQMISFIHVSILC